MSQLDPARVAASERDVIREAILMPDATREGAAVRNAGREALDALLAERDRYKAALREIQYIGGDDLSSDECVRALALARGFAGRMLGAATVGGSLRDEVEALAEKVQRGN